MLTFLEREDAFLPVADTEDVAGQDFADVRPLKIEPFAPLPHLSRLDLVVAHERSPARDARVPLVGGKQRRHAGETTHHCIML